MAMKFLRSLKPIFASTRRFITLGIRREDKNVWEGRTPLPPPFVSALLSQLRKKELKESDESAVDNAKNELKIVVQLCKKRVYSNEDYEKVQ